ncbi:GntR family transcriptional regulator [Agromyces subbeticus]|uniref:GntR family transcriptional regulator n=1 Tax=Agromyces subbeticus TaxID=293890 RepID=UPI0003B62379|nr:GntR family transcriptional regulator [Agromyces subbeticus]
MTVYDELRELVLGGALDQATRFSESSLAERLDVSRTPVREALQRLEADGLVVAQGRGVRVHMRDADELAELYEARSALDGHAASALATLVRRGEMAPARLTELDAIADETDALTRSGDLPAATERNRGFHQRIAQLAGNTVVVATLDRYWDQIVVSTRHRLGERERVASVHDEHRDILARIAAGDADGARLAAADHALTTRRIATERSTK